MKKHILPKNITLFITFGLIYLIFEVIFRAFTFECKILYPNFFSLYGSVSLWMFPVGGLCGLLIGLTNEISFTKNLKDIFKAIIGAFIVLIVEFITGLFFNKLLHLNIWDYSKLILNLYGQICLLFGFIWLFIVPLASWIDEFLKWVIYDEVMDKRNIVQIYKDTFLFWIK